MNLIKDKWIEETLNKSEALGSGLQPWNDYYKLRALEIATLLSLYKIEKQRRVLEIGCGNGFISAVLSKFADHVVATDLPVSDAKTHSVGIPKAKELLKILEIENCKIVSCAGDKLPFEDNTFDMIFCIYTLEHIRNRAGTLEEARRVLTDNGVAMFLVPSFMERLFYPFIYYHEIFRKAICQLFGNKGDMRSSRCGKDIAQYNERYNIASSSWRKFHANYPHFPMPDPHGAYSDYFTELFRSASFMWFKLIGKTGLRIKAVFTTMLFPKALFSLLLGDRSLDFYIKTVWMDKKFGQNVLLRHLGQNLCLVLEKENG